MILVSDTEDHDYNQIMHLREGELRDAIPSKISFQNKEGNFESGRNFKNTFNKSI